MISSMAPFPLVAAFISLNNAAVLLVSISVTGILVSSDAGHGSDADA